MTDKSKPIMSGEFIKIICGALQIPPDQIRRLTIDAISGQLVRIYIEMYGSRLSVDWSSLLGGIDRAQTVYMPADPSKADDREP